MRPRHRRRALIGGKTTPRTGKKYSECEVTIMHIHPISGDERHRCAFVASASRLTLSNIDPLSRHPRNLQVKLWATIWTLMSIGRATVRMCSARVKRPNGGGACARKALGGGVASGPPNVSRETL